MSVKMLKSQVIRSSKMGGSHVFQPTWLIYVYTGTRFQTATFFALKSLRAVLKSSVKTYLTLHIFANFYLTVSEAQCTYET